MMGEGGAFASSFRAQKNGGVKYAAVPFLPE
jgi:hypothetical protein